MEIIAIVLVCLSLVGGYLVYTRKQFYKEYKDRKGPSVSTPQIASYSQPQHRGSLDEDYRVEHVMIGTLLAMGSGSTDE